MFLPRALSSITDARNALTRLSLVFHAELVTDAALIIDPEQELALEVKGAVFQWESVLESKPDEKKRAGGKDTENSKVTTKEQDEKQEARVPFQVQSMNMRVPRGSLVAIVGPVGSGKVCHLSAIPANWLC